MVLEIVHHPSLQKAMKAWDEELRLKMHDVSEGTGPVGL